MSAKQDRVYTRTAAQLKQEMNFGESFAEVMGIATDARATAEQAKNAADNPSENLTHDEVFNLLTNDGALQGIYRGDDGDLYINASYLKSGTINADLIKSGTLDAGLLKTGVIQNEAGDVSLDLESGQVTVETIKDGNPGKIVLSKSGIELYGLDKETGELIRTLFLYSGYADAGTATSTTICVPSTKIPLSISSNKSLSLSGDPIYISGISGQEANIYIAGKKISWKDNGDGTYTLIGT